MAVSGVSGLAVAASGAGMVLVWSGIKGANVSQTFRSLIGGKQPAGADPALGINASFAAAPAVSADSSSSGSGSGPAPSVAGTYSHAQLEQLWRSQGGAGATANMAAAIAQAESGGRASETNHNTNGTTDRGLWQINSIWGSKSTYDPAANARAAISISSNGLNWQPWSTFGNGAYRQFLGAS